MITVHKRVVKIAAIFVTTIKDETLEQVSQFTYLGCNVSYRFSNDVEFNKSFTINWYY
jgi:hypothetical protein